MKIKILGAHSYESSDTKLSSILIDEVMVVDAGGMTSSLTFAQQEKIKYIVLTHGHYDHIRDIPAFALRNGYRTTDVYATPDTLDILTKHLINGRIYPDFTCWPSPENPALRLNILEPLKSQKVGAYEILPLPMSHAIPSVGFQVTGKRGQKVFISGDTGPGLASCWPHISPSLMIVEMSFSNKSADLALKPGHLCPNLLGLELASFHQAKGYYPKVILTHMDPAVEGEIRQEAAKLAEKLGADIRPGFEGMVI